MPYLSWHESFTINVAEIDQQHRRMFDLAVELHRLLEQPSDLETLLRQFDRLEQVTREHFAFEEGLMAEHGYPGLEHHRREHERLLSELATIRTELSRGSLPQLAADYEVTDDWVVAHIRSLDRELGEFLNARKVF